MAFSFGGTPAAPAATASPAPANELVIPDIYTIFPHLKLAEEIDASGIADASTQAQQILEALIHNVAAAAAPDHNLRNQLLSINLKVNGQAAKLNRNMQADVIEIANALRVPEATAIGLYHSAGCSYHGGSVKDASIRLYWDCRMRQVRIAKAILLLGLHEEDGVAAVNFLLTESLFQNISRGLHQRRMKHHEEYPFTNEIHAERDVLAETAYFACYHLQQTTTHVPNWIDAVLQHEHIQTLDPFRQVTHPDAPNWEATWVKDAFSTGLPQDLRTYSILVAASACRPNAMIDISELRFKVIPAIATLPDVVESKVLARDFFLTSLATYLAGIRHQHPDWFAAANLLCSMGLAGCFEKGPVVASNSDDPHALVFAHFTQQTMAAEESNRVLQVYKNQLNGTPNNSTQSTFGNEYYSLHTSYATNEASTVTQKTLGDAARASVMAHAFHATDLKLLLEFALGTPIDRKVRGILFESSARIIQDDDSADLALRILAEFHAVPPRVDTTNIQQHFMFFLPSDVEKASHQEGVRYDASFGMLFSIYISERDTGCEATIGFLNLLTTLAQYITLPALYAEYAVFVLEHMKPKTDLDRDTVYAAAMEFLRSILVRYDCYSKEFGYEDLNCRLIVDPPQSNTTKYVDFPQIRHDKLARDNMDVSGPSAGFSVLVSMLCRNRCSLLRQVVTVLKGSHGDTVSSFVKVTLTKALYGDISPSRATARFRGHVSDQQRKVCSEKERNNIVFFPGDNCQMKAVQAALTLLCATLMREVEFQRKMQASGRAMRYVPVLKTLPVKSVEDGTVHLSENLVSLFVEASPWSSLIEKIGVETGDPGVEALVSAMATAALWGLLEKLSLPQISQVLHTQVDNGQGGTKLAKSVTVRLKSYLSRLLTTEDVCYLRFLTKSVLADLQSGDRVVGTSLFGSSSQVMETLVCLCESDEFLFGENSADVASQCFEIIYRLTKLGEETAISASRAVWLRGKDFWNLSLKRLQRENVSIHHAHAVSWLLKSFAHELSLVGGAASGSSLSPADQQLLAPQPSFYTRYISDLLLGDDCYTSEALKWLCAEYTLPVPPALLSHKNVISARNESTEEYVGPEGLGVGFIINTKLLREKLGEIPELDEVEAWCIAWNKHALLEGAKVHLTDALWTVLGSVALTSLYTMSTNNQLTVSGSASLFSTLLELLTHRSLSGPVARTLAKMVFTASGIMFHAGVDEDSAHAAMFEILQAMGLVGENSTIDSNEHERVSLLGSALILLSKSFTGSAFLLNETIYPKFRDAFRALVAASLFDSVASSSTRKVLYATIAFAKAGTDTVKLQTLMREEFTSATTEALVKLCHDEATLLVFMEACSIPGISRFMMDRGVLLALRNVATKHRRMEDRERCEEKSELRISVKEIKVPQNLHAMLRCMSTFMASADLENDPRQGEIRRIAFDILECYKHVFDRAIADFPRNDSAPLLLAFTQYAFLAEQTALTTETNVELVDFVKVVAETSLRISNNLLPWGQQTTYGGLGWWSELNDENLTRQPLSKAVCNKAIEAAELAAVGISLLHAFCKKHLIQIGKLDHDELWETISRCYDTVGSMERMIGSSIGGQGFDFASADLTDLRRLYKKCYDVLTSLLLTALARLRAIKPTSEPSAYKTMRILDLMSTSVERLDGVIVEDQKRRDGILASLVEAVKSECKGQTKSSGFQLL